MTNAKSLLQEKEYGLADYVQLRGFCAPLARQMEGTADVGWGGRPAGYLSGRTELPTKEIDLRAASRLSLAPQSGSGKFRDGN